MTTIKPLLAKILIQVGADEPKEIGTIEIPIVVSIDEPAALARPIEELARPARFSKSPTN